MSNQNRQTLRQYFQTGNTPTQDQFADLIDSSLNQVDDAITCDANGQIGIGNPAPTANLNVRGRLFTPLSGTVSVVNGTTAAVGTGTSFDKEIAAGDAIRIGSQNFKVESIADATHLQLATAATAAVTSAAAYRDANLLLIENGNGDAAVVIDKSGNVGIGTATPTARLHVAGNFIATELAGEGSGITNLSAANIEGTLKPAQLPPLTADQIPDLPASKITSGRLKADQLPALIAEQIPDLPASKITTGQLKADQLPALIADQIPDLPASKITSGQLKADQLPALIAEQIPDLPASKITTGQLKLDQMPKLTPDQIPDLPASKITGLPTSPDNEWIGELQHAISVQKGHVGIGTSTPQSKLEIAAQDGLRVTGYQPFITLEDTNAANKRGYLQCTGGNLNFIPDSFHAANSAAMVIENGTGTVKVPGTVRANQFEGSGAGITDIPAANITGKLSPAQLPSGGVTEISAANITGVLNPAQMPSLDKITGVLTVDQIPELPASKINAPVQQSVGPGGRPLLASGSISPGSSQNVYAIPMTDTAGVPLAGAYSLEIYTIYMWVAYTDVSAANIGAFNVMTRTVLAGTASIVGGNPLQIEPLNAGPAQTNHADPKFPAVTCSIVSGAQQAWLQISTTAGDPTLTLPPSQFSTPLQYYVYSLM